MKEDKELSDHLHKNQLVYKFDTLLMKQNGNISAGEFSLQFKLQVPDQLHPSFILDTKAEIFSLQYYLKAQFVPVDDRGWLNKE
jgi:hypothetical protein